MEPTQQRPVGTIVRFEWNESATNEAVAAGGCLLLISIFIFWPLAILGGLIMAVAGLAGLFQKKVVRAVHVCSACHKKLPSGTVIVCHACQTALVGVDVRHFADGAKATEAEKAFGISP